MGHANALDYGLSFIHIALEESMQIQRERLAASVAGMRAARFADDEQFARFIDGLQEPNTLSQPITEAEITKFFG